MTLRARRPAVKPGRPDDLFTPDVRLRTFAAIGELRCHAAPLSRLLRQVARTISEETGCAFVALQPSGAPGKESPPPARVSPPGAERAPFTLPGVRSGRILVVSPLGRSRHARHVRALRLKNLVVLPLSAGKVQRGLLALGSPARPVTSAGDLRFLRRLARLIGPLLADREERHRLEETAAKYRSLLLGIPDTVMIVDRSDGRIMEVNARASRLTGISRAALKGRSVFSL
ncbi:MAG TPA: PAS domain-containing protein, partial [Bacteroidota bacterium]|nr:PAS domain-containing protein [Bacteroidota bacterium]